MGYRNSTKNWLNLFIVFLLLITGGCIAFGNYGSYKDDKDTREILLNIAIGAIIATFMLLLINWLVIAEITSDVASQEQVDKLQDEEAAKKAAAAQTTQLTRDDAPEGALWRIRDDASASRTGTTLSKNIGARNRLKPTATRGFSE